LGAKAKGFEQWDAPVHGRSPTELRVHAKVLRLFRTVKSDEHREVVEQALLRAPIAISNCDYWHLCWLAENHQFVISHGQKRRGVPARKIGKCLDGWQTKELRIADDKNFLRRLLSEDELRCN